MLLHHPCEFSALDAALWEGLEEALARNLTRAIGVSNYNSSHIEEIAASGMVMPAVNQIQFSPHHGPLHAPCTCGRSTSRPTAACGDSPCLYNVSVGADAAERHNVASAHPEVVARLSAQLQAAACPTCDVDYVSTNQ